MAKDKLPKPIADEEMMAALEDYFYKTFWEDLNRKDIDAKGLKKVADKCASDSSLRKIVDGSARQDLRPTLWD